MKEKDKGENLLISEEEAENNFEQELEWLEHEPSYMRASLEEFRLSPSKKGAKRLWLKYTLQREPIPKDVTLSMVEIITKQVLADHEKHGHAHTKHKKDDIFNLLHLIAPSPEERRKNPTKTEENQDYFWKLLHDHHMITSLNFYDTDILATLRNWLPKKCDFNRGEQYNYFEALYYGEDNPQNYHTESFAQLFRKWRNKKNSDIKLFEE